MLLLAIYTIRIILFADCLPSFYLDAATSLFFYVVASFSDIVLGEHREPWWLPWLPWLHASWAAPSTWEHH